MEERLARIVIGAIQGRSGKTTFTIGLLRAMKNQGYKVQPFKKGPDYIDPSWATMASGVQSRNLDMFMTTEEKIRESLMAHSRGAHLAVIEGAMGLFDGFDVQGSNSTAELAYITKSPVILVVNGQRITRSVAAIVQGVVHFNPRITIGGVILNQVARARHENIMRSAIEYYTDVQVLGALPKAKEVEIPDRHLGLIPAGERVALQNRIDKLGQLVTDHVDLKALMEVASTAQALEVKEEKPIIVKTKEKISIGVVKDEAFSFYYPENIEALEKMGANVILINSIVDTKLPEIQGLYLGGGFPEVWAKELSANNGLREDIAQKIEAGMPVYAECGGLMYLCESILVDGEDYPMVGVFPAKVVMEKKPQGHGYAIQEATEANPFFKEGTVLKGHEFHNSRVILNPEATPVFGYQTKRGHGLLKTNEAIKDGLVYKNTLATYHHYHAMGEAPWAENFVDKAIAWIDKKKLL